MVGCASIGIPQDMHPAARESAAPSKPSSVTVVGITDPTAAREGIEVLEAQGFGFQERQRAVDQAPELRQHGLLIAGEALSGAVPPKTAVRTGLPTR